MILLIVHDTINRTGYLEHDNINKHNTNDST